MSPVFLLLSLIQLFIPGTAKMKNSQSSKEERQECKMCCDRRSKCYGDSEEGVTVLGKEDRMKKDKEVAYRGSDS